MAHRGRTVGQGPTLPSPAWGPRLLALVAVFLALALTRVTPVLGAGVVGDGTPGSCTDAALDAKLAGGGMVTFNCGNDPVTITLTSEKVISDSVTVDGGGLVTLSGGGTVGVLNVNGGATLEVRNLTIANGYRESFGGGIANYGTLTVKNCTLSSNSTGLGQSGGGGISNEGELTVTNSTLSSNSTGTFGGGIFNLRGTVAVTNSTLTANSARSLLPLYGGNGGGIANLEGTVTVTNCTLTGNSATTSGGGIVDWTLQRGTTLSNTIIANSTSGGNCAAYVNDGGHNLVDDDSCGLTNGMNGNIVGEDPKLDPTGLKDNGGPTQTIALREDSPARDAGDLAVCAAPPVNGVDQRGYARPGPGSENCSIGAFEYGYPPPPLTVTPTLTPTATPSPSATATATHTATLTATPTPTASATPSPSVTSTATTRPSDGGGGGCTVTPSRSGAVWWLLVPVAALLGARRRLRGDG